MIRDPLAKARRQSRDENLHRYPQVSRDAGKLAAAVAVLLKVTDSGAPMILGDIWRAIDEVVPRTDLRAAVDNLRRVVPTPNQDPDAEWRGSATGWSGGACLSWWTASTSGPRRRPARCWRPSVASPSFWRPGQPSTCRMVVSGTPGLPAVDLIYRQEAGPRPEVVISDAGPYSDILFGILNLLDIEYRPEPADLSDSGCGTSTPRLATGPWPPLPEAGSSWRRSKLTCPTSFASRLPSTGPVSARDVIRMLSRGGGRTQPGEPWPTMGGSSRPLTSSPTSTMSPTGA
jgi:hypothetical protein